MRWFGVKLRGLVKLVGLENMNSSKEFMFFGPNQSENMNKSKEFMFSSPDSDKR